VPSVIILGQGVLAVPLSQLPRVGERALVTARNMTGPVGTDAAEEAHGGPAFASAPDAILSCPDEEDGRSVRAAWKWPRMQTNEVRIRAAC
jgi:hypothetical protein